MDLVQWLRAQFDEDERLARSMHPDPVASMALKYETAAMRMRSELKAGKSERVPYDEGQADALHWAAVVLPERMPAVSPFGQARVLREIDAKRILLADLLAEPHFRNEEDNWYSCAALVDEDGDPICSNDTRAPGPCDCGRDTRVLRRVRLLASPYADRPGFEEEWRP